MPFVDDPNDANDNTAAGASPLAQGQAAQPQTQEQDTQDNMSAPTNTSSAQIQGQQQQQTTNINKKAPKASSGMFTNIQKYVEKNKPQAQRMSQAVTEDFSKKAQNIRSAAQEKQQQQQSVIQANQAQMKAQKAEAKAAVGQIMNPDTFTQKDGTVLNVGDTYTAPILNEHGQIIGSEEKVWEGNQQKPYEAANEQSMKRFQELMGGPIGLQKAQDLNISKEQMKAQELGRLAKGAQTEQGRRNMLGETFAKQGAYNRGMSGLDQLITSGDAQARQALIEGTQQTAEELQGQEGLRGLQSQANKNKLAQDIAMQNFGTDISNLGTEAQQEIMNQVNQQVEDQRALMQKEMQAMKDAAQGQFKSRYSNEMDFYNQILSGFSPAWSKAGNRDRQDYWSIRKHLLGEDVSIGDQLRRMKGGWETYTDDQGQTQTRAMDESKFDRVTLGAAGNQRLQTAFQDLLQNAADFGLDPSTYQKQLEGLAQADMRKNVYGWSGHRKNRVGDIYTYDPTKFKEITSQLFSDINQARDNAFAKQLENKYGLGAEGAEKFLSGEAIDAAGVASQEQADRMAALQNLLGKETNPLGTELGGGVGQDLSFYQKLKKDLGIG